MSNLRSMILAGVLLAVSPAAAQFVGPAVTVIAGFTTLLALPVTDALAQTKAAVGGMVTLKLSDPDGGEPWQVQRQLLRTFDTVQDCENQKESFIGFHVGRVESQGLVTASGKSPVVEVESIECFMVRGDIDG